MTNMEIKKIEIKKTEFNHKDFQMIEVVVENIRYLLSKEELKQGIERVFNWQYCKGTDFGTKLVELIAKADDNNRFKIMRGFPETVIAYLLWFNKEFNGTVFNDDNEFFECMRMKLS